MPGQRGLRFSEQELTTMVDEILRVEPQLFGAELQNTSQSLLRSYWARIVERVNGVGTVPRTVDKIRKRWNDLKAKVKKAQSAYLRACQEAGDRTPPPPPDFHRWEQRVADSLPPEGLVGVQGVVDSGLPPPETPPRVTGPNQSAAPQDEAQEDGGHTTTDSGGDTAGPSLGQGSPQSPVSSLTRTPDLQQSPGPSPCATVTGGHSSTGLPRVRDSDTRDQEVAGTSADGPSTARPGGRRPGVRRRRESSQQGGHTGETGQPAQLQQLLECCQGSQVATHGLVREMRAMRRGNAQHTHRLTVIGTILASIDRTLAEYCRHMVHPPPPPCVPGPSGTQTPAATPGGEPLPVDVSSGQAVQPAPAEPLPTRRRGRPRRNTGVDGSQDSTSSKRSR